MTLYAPRLEHAVGAAHLTVERERVEVRPGSAAEIADVLRIAGEVGVVVGTGVRSGIALDFQRMRNVLHLDETSLLVQVQAGITAEALDELLAERGLALQPLPATSRGRTVGALLAAPRPSEASPRFGRFTAGCAGVSGLLADGTEITTRVAPRKATGPDLMHALVGARGTLGILTAATLRLQRRGEVRQDAAWSLLSPLAALDAARMLLVRGGRPLELSVAGATLSITVDGPPQMVNAERELAAKVASLHGGQAVPHAPPPRDSTPPRERAISIERVEELAPALDGSQARVVGWHVSGAALVDPARKPEPPPAPPPFARLLKQRMDPDGRLPAWPGT